MSLFFLEYEQPYAPWLAPYLLGLVICAILAYSFKFFQNWYSLRYHRPLYRDLFVFRKLNVDQREFLEKEFEFYRNLSQKNKRRFQHRVAAFILKNKFTGREGFEITDKVRVIIAANACMLSFGRKNYLFRLVEIVVLFPDSFYSELIDGYRDYEFNPRRKAIVFSWNSIEEHIIGPRNPVVFEFMHAMQLEARVGSDMDSQRFHANYQNLLRHLMEDNTKAKLEELLLKEYSFSNEFEFTAVLAELFFEQKELFRSEFPELYTDMSRMLGLVSI